MLAQCSYGHGEQLALSFLFASPWIYFWLCTRLKTGLEATSVLNGKLGQDTERLPNLCLMRKSVPIVKWKKKQRGKDNADLQICKKKAFKISSGVTCNC